MELRKKSVCFTSQFMESPRFLSPNGSVPKRAVDPIDPLPDHMKTAVGHYQPSKTKY